MKGKISLKTIIIFAILILAVVLSVLGVRVVKTFMSGAATDYEPQNLTAVSSADGNTATVSWTTDKATAASVFYGTNMASLLFMGEEAQETTSHSISLMNLKSGKTYFYKIVAGDNEYNNNGTMYTFKTSGKAEETTIVTPTPTIAPAVTLPVVSPTVAQEATASACNKTTDYVKDGVINSLDYISCLRGKLTPTTSATR